jgi:hypothetical protein
MRGRGRERKREEWRSWVGEFSVMLLVVVVVVVVVVWKEE